MIGPWGFLLVRVPEKVTRVDQFYLFWRLVSIDLVFGYLGKKLLCVLIRQPVLHVLFQVS